MLTPPFFLEVEMPWFCNAKHTRASVSVIEVDQVTALLQGPCLQILPFKWTRAQQGTVCQLLTTNGPQGHVGFTSALASTAGLPAPMSVFSSFMSVYHPAPDVPSSPP